MGVGYQLQEDRRVTLVFCILSVCQPLTSLSFVPESAPPHYLHVVANGVEYGRVAPGTYFDVPQSVIVQDEIAKRSFEQ